MPKKLGVHVMHHCKNKLQKLYYTIWDSKGKATRTLFCENWMWCAKCEHPVQIELHDPLGVSK